MSARLTGGQRGFTSVDKPPIPTSRCPMSASTDRLHSMPRHSRIVLQICTKAMIKPRTCTLVFLVQNQRYILQRIVNDPDLSERCRLRAQALLLADRSANPDTTDGHVADETGLSRATVSNIRVRYNRWGIKRAITAYVHEGDRIERLMRPQVGEGLVRRDSFSSVSENREWIVK